MSPWEPGMQMGPYELLEPVGTGGMGEVWKARDARLNRVVAIKRFKGQHEGRFKVEARAIAALNHPHICQVHDVGPDYLVLEFIDGQPLACPVGHEEAVRLALDIACAIEAAHQKGILHRDLKPANILLTRERSIKLLDFGLAKLLAVPDEATVTVEGSVMGTAAYMSPEQAEGKALDERSDVFSFGAVLYELLSGRRAFNGTTVAQVLTAVLHQEPAPIQAPATLERVIRRCLAKRPAERYQTMTEVRRALEGHSVEPDTGPPSIAVLPFANMSGDKDQEYFSDGLAEEIINALARISGLKVIARTSAFAFKGQNVDVRRIAEALGVDHVLEGSVRRAGGRIRVTAQLILAKDGGHVWSDRYDRELEDVFAVQDEIARAIVTALQGRLVPSIASAGRYEPNLEAYEAFLKAQHWSAVFSPERLKRSKEYLEQAITLDPRFALPYPALAQVFVDESYYSLVPANHATALARSLAYKALARDPSLPDAHSVLGVVAALHDYDWTESEREFCLAMTPGQASPRVSWRYALSHLRPGGWFLEVEALLKNALHADPISPSLRYGLAMVLYVRGEQADATSGFHHVLELDDRFIPAWYWLTRCLTTRGMTAEARAAAEKAYALTPWNTEAIGGLAGLLHGPGDDARAAELLAQLGDGQAFGAPLGFASYHFLRGEIDLAADWMERAIEQRHFLATLYVACPLADSLRESARWPAFAEKLNLPA